MLLRVPQSYPIFEESYSGYGLPGLGKMGLGARGLGQCDPTDPSCIEFPTVPTGSGVYPGPGQTCVADASGQCVGPVISTSDVGTPPPGSAVGLTPAQIAQIIASGSAASANIIHSATGPYVVPGTNVVYNPNTGQLVGGPIGAVATGLSQVLAGPNIVPIAIAAVIGLAVMMSLIGGRR